MIIYGFIFGLFLFLYRRPLQLSYLFASHLFTQDGSWLNFLTKSIRKFIELMAARTASLYNFIVLIFNLSYNGLNMLSSVQNGKSKISLSSLMNQVDSTFTICEGQKAASIKYSRFGTEYVLFVPYERKLAIKTGAHKAFLIKGQEKIDITQQPGIPYLVTPNELGGECIEIVGEETVTKFYRNEHVVLDK
jgi:hypothetical protein